MSRHSAGRQPSGWSGELRKAMISLVVTVVAGAETERCTNPAAG